MRIARLLSLNEPSFSFEFFPPKTDAGVTTLFETVAALRPLAPAFVSVTYGAGGSTRERTVDLVVRIKAELRIEAMAHVTCAGATRGDLAGLLDRLAAGGVENVLALRGDPPRGAPAFAPVPGGFHYASELVALVRSERARWDFCLGGACYPQKHPEAPDPYQDLLNLKAKVDAGAEFLITQMFFDNSYYFDFVDRARRLGVDVPIVPGIMPVTNAEQIERIAALSGVAIPERFAAELRDRRGDPQAALELGVAFSTLQCADLLRRGAPGIHFYTLNRSSATRAILAALRAAQPWHQR